MPSVEILPNGAEPENPGPYAVLAARARRESDGALVVYAAVGCAWLVLLLLWRPAWWSFIVAPVALGAFGLWGIADRELAAPGGMARHRLLRVACGLAAVIGTIAVLVSAFRLIGAVVGRVIS